MKKSLFDRVLVLGAGEVVRDRVRSALKALRPGREFDRVYYVDLKHPGKILEEMGPFEQWEEYYQNTDPDALPMDWMKQRELLSKKTLVLNCLPTKYHVPLSRQIAPHVGRIGVEKPLASTLIEAATLSEFEDVVNPIGHQLRKPLVDALLERAREIEWSKIRRLMFALTETKPVGPRDIDDAIWDLGWHAIEILIAPLHASGLPVMINLFEVLVSTYCDGPDKPRKKTAAAIEGEIDCGSFSIPFSARVGKGLAANAKSLMARMPTQPVQTLATLDDKPPQTAHERLIQELLTAQKPDMRLGFNQVLSVVDACESSQKIARVMPAYKFGTTPKWMQFPFDESTDDSQFSSNVGDI